MMDKFEEDAIQNGGVETYDNSSEVELNEDNGNSGLSGSNNREVDEIINVGLVPQAVNRRNKEIVVLGLVAQAVNRKSIVVVQSGLIGEFGVVELENNGNSGKMIVWFEFVGLLLEEERNSGFRPSRERCK